MRFIFILISLLAPQIVFAQLKSFEAGSLVLVENPAVRYVGQLKLRRGELVVKGANGKTSYLKPEEVVSFQIDSHKFLVIKNFEVGSALGNYDVKQAFVEELDSGQVTLLRYDYYTNNGARSMYLLRRSGLITSMLTNESGGGGNRFRESLMPFLFARPDLVVLLRNKQILPEDMPLVVRALNTGQPMPPTPSYLNRN